MKIVNYLTTALILLFFSYEIWIRSFTAIQSKVSVVQMDKLVEEYSGMREAQAIYKQKMEIWSRRIDSLSSQIMLVAKRIESDSIKGNRNAVEEHRFELNHLLDNYKKVSAIQSDYGQKEDAKMTLGVLNQLRNCIAEYSRANNIDMVLLNVHDQNVAFVKESIDITEEIIEYSNKLYEGEE